MDPLRADRIYRFILNEIAISERQVDFYKSFRMSWTTVVITGLLALGSLALSMIIDGRYEMVMLLLPWIVSFIIAGASLWYLSWKRVCKAKQMSAVLYSLVLRGEFELLNAKEPLDDPFNILFSEWDTRRNLDRLGSSANSYPTSGQIGILNEKILKTVQKEQGMTIEEYLDRLRALYQDKMALEKTEKQQGQPTAKTD